MPRRPKKGDLLHCAREEKLFRKKKNKNNLVNCTLLKGKRQVKIIHRGEQQEIT